MPSLGNFDPNQYQNTYEPLPAGDYLVMITESSIDTLDDGVQKVKVTMEVMQPEQYYSRKAFASYTLESPNPRHVEVGRKILANLCRAIGVMAPRETEELHGIPFCVRLTVEQWDDGSLHNEAKAYWSTQSQAPPQPKPKAPKQQQAGPGSQYQPPAPPAWQPPTAPQQRPQAPQQPWQQPQGGAPGGFRPGPPQQPAQPQQWQQPPAAPQMGHSGINPWPPAPVQAPQQPQQPYYQPQAPQQPQYPPQPQQPPYQQPAQPQAPQAPAGPPPWAQQPQAAPQPQQPMLEAEGDEVPF